MASYERVQVVEHSQEPTLGVVLRSVVVREIPERFFLLIQLAAPWAFQFARLGWWNSARAMAAISAFGVWGLCEHRLLSGETTGWKARILRAGRLCGAIATAGILGAFLQHLMITVPPELE